MASRLLLVLLLCPLVAPHAAGQSPAPAQPKERFDTATTAVMVDVVVRDKKGNPVTTLRKEDFELLEDGVGQEIVDAVLVAPPPASHHAGTAVTAAPASPPDPSRSRSVIAAPTFVALVFDRLSVEARALAHKGALAYLDTFHDDDFAGVFLSDLSLTTIQTYTNDRVRLRKAIDEVATRPTSIFDREATRPIRDRRGYGDNHPSVPVIASAEFVGRKVDGLVPGLEREIHNNWETLAREQQGYATTNALLALTTALGMLPGRKTVVFFAEGLALPELVLPHFRNVVATANRANVSVYTIDAAGLRVHSKDADIGREVRAIGMAQLALNDDGSSQSNLGLLERNEDVLRKDPRTSLTLLAQETGGFLVDSTNDLARAFRSIDADRRFHYLLTYTPRNADFNGEWRTLAVKVPRQRDVTVRARTGYLAVRAPGAIPLLTHEGPALAALDRSPAPADIPIRSAALVFPSATGARLALLATAAAKDVTFARDDKTATYHTDFTILARIRNEAGEVVRKASQPYRLGGALAQIEQARRGDVLFFRQPELSPGSYTLDVAVHDALARRAGVQKTTFVVQEPQAVQVSSLVLVRRAERLSSPVVKDDGNPLRVGDVLVYPNVGEPISRRDKVLTIFVTLQLAPGSTPQARLDVLRGDQSVASIPIVLETPDAGGRLQQLAQMPVAPLTAGDYTLRLVLTHEGRREVREASFRLID